MEATQAVEVTQPTEGVQEEVGQEAKKDAVQAAPPPPKKDIRKAKVNGKEVEVDVEDLLRDYQKYTSGSQRLEEAALKEKKLSKWLEDAKGNPWSVFESFGLNPDELAEQRLLKKMEYEMLSPDARRAKDLEREAERLKAQLQEAEDERKKTKEALEADKIEALRSGYAKELDEAIPKFFKEKNLEATPEAIVYAIENIIAHAEQHGEELDINTALEQATERFDGLLSKHVSKLAGDALLKILTPAQLEAIRKHQLNDLYQKNPLRQKAETRQATGRQAKSSQRMRTDDFFKTIGDRYE